MAEKKTLLVNVNRSKNDGDISEMQVSGQCILCVHRFTDENSWGTCEAFPDGIPLQVYAGIVPHTSPIEGDHGIQFRLINDRSS